MAIDKKQLYEWCRVPAEELENHPDRKVPFRLVKDSKEMGNIMARELVDAIKEAGQENRKFHAIIPCGPSCWYEPFTSLVNKEKVSLRHLEVFHMDDCLTRDGKELPRSHPYSFRGEMERMFYEPVEDELAVPEEQRHWPRLDTIEWLREHIGKTTIDLTYGGWGQDGHMAYNQAVRNPYTQASLDELRNSTVRIQENNWDTIIALAQRTFGTAYQFVPPMSVTLGLKECLSARKVRLFSDTGAWKQTALRVALFSEPDPEYPITLLQEHPDGLLTATENTAAHPISLHPEWDLGL
jgi:glucosamine-6-phosphate deaminase